MRKFKKLDKWFAVQLSELVLCGEIYTKYGPKVVYTKALWGLKDDLAVCRDSIYKLGKVDKVWIKSEDAHILDDYELR